MNMRDKLIEALIPEFRGWFTRDAGSPGDEGHLRMLARHRATAVVDTILTTLADPDEVMVKAADVERGKHHVRGIGSAAIWKTMLPRTAAQIKESGDALDVD